MNILDEVPEHIRTLIPYAPGKPIEEVEREFGISGSIKLASNENPLELLTRSTSTASALTSSEKKALQEN